MKRCKVNCGQLQDNLIAENLMGKHASRPYNPNIADVFYLAGFIESWGRCIEKYVKHVNQMILPMPKFTINPGDIMVKFTAPEERVVCRPGGETERVTEKVIENESR